MLKLTRNKKILIALIIIAAAAAAIIITDFGKNLSLSDVQQDAGHLKEKTEQYYIPAVVIFIGAYIAVNLWFPAAAVFTLLAGYLYGTIPAAVYVLTAAVTGALISFEMSRYLLGNRVQKRWHKQLEGFNQELEKYGNEYLVLVRMIPCMPYVLVNVLAGLTRIRPRTFAWTTAIGCLPGILIYSYAGRQLLRIQEGERILSIRTIIVFAAMLILAAAIVVFRRIMNNDIKNPAVSESTV